MKTHALTISALVLTAMATATIAQSKYSGIYSGKVAGKVNFLAAITAGGRLLALDNTTEGLRDATDPAKSTVSATGRVKGSIPNGSSVVATVSPKFAITGTIKDGKETIRFSGKRTFQ
jgi:hypothetical protein